MLSTVRARRGLVAAVAALAVVVAVVAAAVQDGEDAAVRRGVITQPGDDAGSPSAGSKGKARWPDLAKACAGVVVPDDRVGVERAGDRFFAGKPEMVASDTGVAMAVAVFRSRDGKAHAVCRGTDVAGSLTFRTTVHPARPGTPAQDDTPLFPESTCTAAGACVVAFTVADRLHPKVASVQVRFASGEEVALAPQEDRWIARLIEVRVASTSEEVPVARVLYLDSAGEHLAEWVPAGAARNPALPWLARFPGLEQDCLLGAGC